MAFKMYDGQLVQKKVRNLSPISGWKKFIDSMINLKLLSLPDEKELPAYNGCGGADGIGYYFEWSTMKKYRYYCYCNPDLNVDNFWQAVNVLRIAGLLEREFGFEYIK